MAEVNEVRVDVDDGKYTVILREDGTSTALRYGEDWPAQAGKNQLNNLEVALARDLMNAQVEIERQREVIDGISSHALAMAFHSWGEGEAQQAFEEIFKAAEESLGRPVDLKRDQQFLNLDKSFIQSLIEAAKKSNWIPPEYFVNDWVSDCQRFLETGEGLVSFDLLRRILDIVNGLKVRQTPIRQLDTTLDKTMKEVEEILEKADHQKPS